MFAISAKASGRTSALFVLAMCCNAFAHPGHLDSAMATSASLMSGFSHPFSGIDHLLAMLAVGLWAAQSRRSAQWVLPLVFPVTMVVGALLAFSGVQLPLVEGGIAASVAVLGLLIAFAVKMPLWASTVVVSLFALLHGYAHGSELPHASSAMMYGVGFVAATALLHAAGLGFGLLAGRSVHGKVVRLGGVGIAAVGAYLLSGM